MRLILRILMYLVLAVVVVVVLGAGFIYFRAQRAMAATYDNPKVDLKVNATPEQLERGKYLVGTMPGCAGCHATNPAANPPLLDGNRVAVGPLGNFYAPNLTPGGP